jgi:hypothetical protein
MYWYARVCTGTHKYVLCMRMYASVRVCTSIYLGISVYTSTGAYRRVYMRTHQFGVGSKKVQTRFEPKIFYILFTDDPTALKEYRHQIPDICDI